MTTKRPTAWDRAKERAADYGFEFQTWLFVHPATRWGVSSYDKSAGGGFFLIPPVGYPTPIGAAAAAVAKVYRTRTDAMRAANRLAGVDDS